MANRNAANAAYTGQPQAILDQYGSGAGASGLSGKAAVAGDLARRGTLSGVDQSASQAAMSLQQGGLSQAQQLLGHSFGQSSTYGGTQSNSGTSIGPGSAAGGAVGGFGSGLAGMAALMAMMGNGSGQNGSGQGGGGNGILSSLLGPLGW
jgi:hypothetical protein